MRRRLLSFIMLFAITFCFISGCKDDDEEDAVLVIDGKEVVATINDVNYTADDVYNDLVGNSYSAEYIYENLEDLLIRTVVPVTESMRSRVVNEVEKWKKDIRDNATISGTSYKEALATALSEEGVSSEDELIDKKIFALQEEIITNQYWNSKEDEYYSNYLNNRYVYHISQILVSVSTNGNYDYFDVQPSSTVAKKLYDVASSLISGESFYNVALRYSDDSTSKDKGGDLGLVTLNDTTISDEVKYALASYSAYFEDADISYPEYLDNVYENGIETIPQEYIDLLGEVYDDGSTNNITATSNSTTLYSRVYGRAIIFNNLFNSRTFRFLQSTNDKNVKTVVNARMPLVDIAGFEDASSQNIVVNNEENPILVVRSDSGIHFISITKSAFAGSEELAKYYSKTIDTTDDYKTYLEKAIDQSDEEARLETLNSLANDYATMKVSGNSNFAGNDTFIKYDMFNYYLNGTYSGVKFEIKNEKIKNIITQYINLQKKYIQTKIDNVFSEGYEKYANNAEHADSVLIVKEIPILKCLDNKSCTYTYKNGFQVYSSGGGE